MVFPFFRTVAGVVGWFVVALAMLAAQVAVHRVATWTTHVLHPHAREDGTR